MRYTLSPRVEVRSAPEGACLVLERPLRVVRVNRALALLVHRCARGGVTPVGPEEERALEALARGGILERVPEAPAPEDLPSVSVVIPVRDRAGELGRCLRSLARVAYPRDRFEVIVVDDGSRDPSPRVAREHGARVVASGGSGLGPAAARNRGVAVARGEILAFLDSDCTASAGWLTDLVGRFADPAVAAVGGRVEGMHVASRLDRYEAAMSSLSLGTRCRSAREGDDTFYLPSCNLLVRRSAFLEVGGFRDGMHVGEDVDLTWRLRDRGWRVEYTPAGWVWHEHRSRPGAFLRRRFEYGTSEAALQALHPRRRKRLTLPPALTAALGLLTASALGGGWAPAAGAVALVGADAARTRARLARRRVPVGWARVVGARLRALGSLAYYLGSHGVRYYGLPGLLAGLLWPAAGGLGLAVLAGVGWVEHRTRRPALAYPVFLALYGAESLAYGLGVLWGCIRLGSFSSYRPVVYRRMEMPLG